MKVKLIKTQEFYPTMKEWWNGHNFEPVSPSMLPEFTFVCYNDNDTPVYSMCFYNTDSNLAWIGWQISNPKVSKKDTKGCFKLLFEEVEEHAIKNNYQVLFTTTKHPSVEATLEGLGFKAGDTTVNQYIKIL